jgi:hypothetical protein
MGFEVLGDISFSGGDFVLVSIFRSFTRVAETEPYPWSPEYRYVSRLRQTGFEGLMLCKMLFYSFLFLGMAWNSLKLAVILPQSPECWDHRYVPPQLQNTFIYIICELHTGHWVEMVGLLSSF